MFFIKYMRQHDAKDCAAVCLTSVFNIYGIRVSLIHMRELLKIDKNGSNMYALSKVADDFGFETDVLYGEWPDFLKSLERGEIHLPAIFCDLWTGYILNISPSEKLKKNSTDDSLYYRKHGLRLNA